uniref:Uncharacterized protein n=1 Tax=Melopsittacus undulatus TaxID=13146 RepID=A0A8V5HAL0_MELUD
RVRPRLCPHRVSSCMLGWGGQQMGRGSAELVLPTPVPPEGRWQPGVPGHLQPPALPGGQLHPACSGVEVPPVDASFFTGGTGMGGPKPGLVGMRHVRRSGR